MTAAATAPDPRTGALLTRAPAVPDKGLRSGALGLVASTVMGIASTAPAYSLAATLGYLVATVGVHAPGVLLLAFVPMLCIAVAYQQLNAREPDCGTTFTWAAKAFGRPAGPAIGWMGGWGIIAADIIVMANLGQVAGQYGFQLFDLHSLAASTLWTTVAGCAWIAAMTALCYLGIEISSRVQLVMLAIEVGVLLAFAVAALVEVYSGHGTPGSTHPSASWLAPTHLGGFSGLSVGLLLAVFIYWGWDTSVSCNEETADASRTPGRAAVLSTLLLLGTYLLVTVAAQSYAGTGSTGLGLDNSDNSSDVLSVLGNAVLGSALGKLLVLMVLTSAAASTLTSILPTARTTLAMAAYGALPRAFARVSPRTLAPTVSTVVMGVVCIVFYIGAVLAGADLYQDAIGSIGLLIAFYYGLTGFTAAWALRHEVRSARDALLKVAVPLAGGLMLLALFGYGVKEYAAQPSDTATVGSYTTLAGVGAAAVIGVGSLLLGLVLMAAWAAWSPSYFRGRSFAPDDVSTV